MNGWVRAGGFGALDQEIYTTVVWVDGFGRREDAHENVRGMGQQLGF